jgi:hypothetical protein
MYIHFIVPYSYSYTLSPTPPTSHWRQHYLLGRDYSIFLFSDFVGEKGKMVK